ncbi:MAG: right-handed parallel beta-helix repeat-containing protein [Candidatus Zixiibacteriota bacterium]|nr:MAG: right-handed parallel beta-helix repeat-containing protein [candidate division Zixibacteria bacterium]
MTNALRIIVLLSSILYTSASATIINIPGDYPTIQQGIDASNDGDTVLVQPGTYYENINFNGHNIVLGSLFLTTGDTSYIEQTVIDGDSAGTVVTFGDSEDSTTIITGFSIQNGYAENGGGVYCDSGSSPMIYYNIIRENSSYAHGGGIYCIRSSPNIRNNAINGNYADAGGGIYSMLSNIKILDNIISDNISDTGGGVCSAESFFIINNNIINGNIAEAWNGCGGGICCVVDSYGLIYNNTISENSVDAAGGGIFCSESNPTIKNNIIQYNDAYA